jgi:hypothetical protein
MARKFIVAGLVVACLAGTAMASTAKDSELSKKDLKACLRANPGCNGDCIENVDGDFECVEPVDADVDFELCGSSKYPNWQVWDGGLAACTCADGFVTSSKVFNKFEGADPEDYPKASKMCTVECDEDGAVCGVDADPQDNTFGPLDCTCVNDAGKKAEKSADKEAIDEIKGELKDELATLKDEFLTAKEALVDEKQTLVDEAKAEVDALKEELGQAKSDVKNSAEIDAIETELKELKEQYKQDVADAKAEYKDLKSDIKHDVEPLVESKVAAPAVAKVAAPAVPAKPVA